MPDLPYSRTIRVRNLENDTDLDLVIESDGETDVTITAAGPYGIEGGLTADAAKLDELIAAAEAALDTYTPAAPVDTDHWDDVAASLLTRLADDLDNASVVADEIAALDRHEIRALVDALAVRGAAILAAFRDHTAITPPVATDRLRSSRVVATGGDEYLAWRERR